MSNQHEIRTNKSNHSSSKSPQLPPVTDIRFYLESFLLAQQSQRHSSATVSFYRRYVNHFIWFLDHKGYSTALRKITANHIREFLVYLQEDHPEGRWNNPNGSTTKPLKPAAIHAFARALRAFWNWTSKEADLARNPFENVDMPKLPDAWKVQTFTDEEIAVLFRACEHSLSHFLKSRNRTILAMLLDSGVRASELLGLTLSDIDPLSGTFTVTGKGAKRRAVMIGVVARKELLTYLRDFRLEHASQAKALFLTAEGNPLTYNGLKELFNRLRAWTGIANVHAHTCRHTAATLMHRHGMRGSVIQEILGHSSFDVTRKYYLDVSTADLAAEHEQFGPLNHLRQEIKQAQGPLRGQGREAAAKLPEPDMLAAEVARSSYSAIARKYHVSDTAIRKRLKRAGLLP